MRTPPEFLRETHIIGADCREHMLDRKDFPVLGNAPFIWLGRSELQKPYRFVRLRSVHSHVVACVGGTGRTLIDGEAVEWKPGQVLVAPVGLHHAFEPGEDEPWQTAWVFFDDTESAPCVQRQQVELIEADIGTFVSLVRMITDEAAGAADPASMEALVTLLHVATRRLIGGDPVDRRLWQLWTEVESDLGRPWTTEVLAQRARMSPEHLRRLCHRHYQRSPFQHLTHLRMRRASTLLRASTEKIENISDQVGYSTVFSFATAFRRWSGTPPAKYRRG